MNLQPVSKAISHTNRRQLLIIKSMSRQNYKYNNNRVGHDNHNKVKTSPIPSGVPTNRQPSISMLYEDVSLASNYGVIQQSKLLIEAYVKYTKKLKNNYRRELVTLFLTDFPKTVMSVCWVKTDNTVNIIFLF